ncbi:MAG: TonB-dependent receptor [Campylobacterota bacterium]|nr:TonB-dependent receptor [Campylobacterota bacterium]
MNKIKLSLITASILTASLHAADLGKISVESSTIDVTNSKKTESSNINIIDEETIEQVGSNNIIDILKTVPGMTNVARAGEMLQFRFRGVGNQQYMGEKPGVAIIVDGIPIKAISGGVRLNLQDIKSIKIVKGSASYLYGDTALSGAVIITTKKSKTKNESTISSQIGSFGNKELEVSTTQSNEDYSFNLNGTYRKTDGYWTDSELWTKSVNGKVSYYLDDTSDITLGADVTEKYDQGGSRSTISGETAAIENPKGEPDTGYNKDSGIDLNKYFISYNKEYEQSSLKVTAYKYEDLYELTSNPQDIDNDPSTTNIYVNESNDDLNQQGIKAEYTIDGDSTASLIGLELGEQKYNDSSETLADYSEYNVRARADVDYYKGERSDTTSKDETKAIYGEIKYNLTPLFTTTVNGRLNKQDKKYTEDAHDYDGSTWSDTITTNSKSFTNTAYRLGGNYTVSDTINIFGNIATGYETPDVTDLIETPGLEDQTSITYEVGARGTTQNRFTYDVSVYQLENKDILGPEEGTYGFGSPMANIGDSEHKGIEASIKSDQEKAFSYNLAYTYLNAKYTEHLPHTISYQDRSLHTFDIVGNEIPRVSKHTVDLFLNYKVSPKLKLITEIYAKSNYFADEMNLIKMDGYEVVNLQARYDTKLNGNKLELYVKIDNILDKQYYRSAFVHRDKRGDFGVDREDISLTVDPGRVYYAGLKYTF